MIKEISDNPINVYMKLMPLDSGTRIITFVEDGGSFIGESSDKYSKVKSFVKDFGTEAYREKVAEQVKAQEKILNGMEGDLDKLKKQNEKMHADIKDNEASIINAEVDIKANTRQQELKDEEILQQKNVVNATSDKDLKKGENKKLNELERQKDKFRNEINSLNRRIVKSRANIEDLEDEIELNLQEQELLKDKITSQRSLVKGFEGKLAKVK
jgi:chromosome segregation ATPase